MNLTNLLYKIQHQASMAEAPETIIIPKGKKLYEIDLNTREIKGPDVLSVQSDHYSETFYFIVDRFYDAMDLAQTNCVVQYVTNGESYVYAVPFCDITTYEGKIIIPWTISASATKNGGTVKYFLRFYMIEGAFSEDPVSEESEAYFTYSLSTLPTTSTILKTLPSKDFVNEDEILKLNLEPKNKFEVLSSNLGLPERYFEIVDVFSKMVDNATIYWIDV